MSSEGMNLYKNFILKNSKYIAIAVIILTLFFLIWSIFSFSASSQTAKGYKDPVNGLLSDSPPSNEQIQADAKAAQDRDAMNLGIAVAYMFFVLLPIVLFTSTRGGLSGTAVAVGAVAGTYLRG